MGDYNTQVLGGVNAQATVMPFSGVFIAGVPTPVPPTPCPPCECPKPNITPVVVVPPSGHALKRLRDIRFDNQTKQFVMAAGGLTFTYDLDAVRQACEMVCNTFQGECFLDLDAGIPWFQQVLVKAPQLEAIKQMLRAKLLAVTGVNAITSLTLNFNKQDRTLRVDFTCNSDFGELTGSATQG